MDFTAKVLNSEFEGYAGGCMFREKLGISTPVLLVAIVITAVVVGAVTYLVVPKGGTTGGATTTVTTTTTAIPGEEMFKVGFLYSSPIGDYGWYYAQDRARKVLDEEFDWLETISAESGSPADSPGVLEQMAEEGVKLIFVGSAEHTEATFAAAEMHPEIIYYVVGGYKRASNLGAFHSIWHETSYMHGMMGAALSTTGKGGALLPFPMPDLIGQINAFTIGAKEINPDWETKVIETGAYYDPGTGATVTRTLIDGGADVITGVEDTPSDAREAQKYFDETGNQVYTFSRYSPFLDYGPDVVLSGVLYHWEKLMLPLILKAREGIADSEKFLWVEMVTGVEELGATWDTPINPKFIDALQAVTTTDSVFGEISVYDLVMERVAQFKDTRVNFDAFTGPLYDTDGNLKARAGETMHEDDVLWAMDWYVQGVTPPE